MDPKRVTGERYYDYVGAVQPDLETLHRPEASRGSALQ